MLIKSPPPCIPCSVLLSIGCLVNVFCSIRLFHADKVALEGDFLAGAATNKERYEVSNFLPPGQLPPVTVTQFYTSTYDMPQALCK